MDTVLRRERIKRGWTVSQVADKVNVGPSMIYMMETGKRKPSYEVLVKLEDLFQMNHRELFGKEKT